MLLKDINTIKNKNVDITKIIHNNNVIWNNVYMAKDSDFVKIDGYWIYKGSELEVEIPKYIKGTLVTDCSYMFSGSSTYKATPVTKVVLRCDNVKNMRYMFKSSPATTLDLSSFDTSNVTNMSYMFDSSSATTLDLSSFDTSNVTNMSAMFYYSSATTLDLSSFDTSNVTDMAYMFRSSPATTLDLSSFDTSNVTNMSWMLYSSSVTKGYARTQADANRFNASSNKPSGLTFVVK